MKVKIIQRSVYHKIAEVEIEIPELLDKESEIQQYLLNNEDLYVNKIDKAVGETSLDYGPGMIDGMTDWKEPYEWRFEYEDGKYGGHL